jgi:hypothetical protein
MSEPDYKRFAEQVIREWCWDYVEPDGGDLQDLAEKCGIIVPVKVTEPCVEEGCKCVANDDFPTTCYRFVSEQAATSPTGEPSA